MSQLCLHTLVQTHLSNANQSARYFIQSYILTEQPFDSLSEQVLCSKLESFCPQMINQLLARYVKFYQQIKRPVFGFQSTTNKRYHYS